MSALLRLSDDVLLQLFETVSDSSVYLLILTSLQLPKNDLIRCLRVCHRFKTIGIPLLSRQISFPLSSCCARCNKAVQSEGTVEIQRLRGICLLLDPSRACHVRELTVTDTDPFCQCYAGPMNTDARRRSGNLSLEILVSLLARARQLRCLRYGRKEIFHRQRTKSKQFRGIRPLYRCRSSTACLLTANNHNDTSSQAATW